MSSPTIDQASGLPLLEPCALLEALLEVLIHGFVAYHPARIDVFQPMAYLFFLPGLYSVRRSAAVAFESFAFMACSVRRLSLEIVLQVPATDEWLWHR
jgi:hypothetical protein